MPAFDSNGVQINYTVDGDGPAIVLVHGFASSLQGNWRAPGIIDALVNAGRMAVALDCRGHGRSGKPHDSEAYGESKMPDDVIALMDLLDIDTADLMGYSMGGFIASALMVNHPERFRSVILAGVGDAVLNRSGVAMSERAAAIASALEAPPGAASENDTARGFRIFAERTGNNLGALAALQKSRSRHSFDASKLGETTLPVMVLIGEDDTLVGSGDKLTASIPGATLVKVPGDHLTAVGAPELKRATLDFLTKHSPVASASS
ncbi:MAG: alpha/beta hydrolase [Dehalococcoidia bacterium]